MLDQPGERSIIFEFHQVIDEAWFDDCIRIENIFSPILRVAGSECRKIRTHALANPIERMARSAVLCKNFGSASGAPGE